MLGKRRRLAQLKASFTDAADSSVLVAGTERRSEFHADEVVALIVPDALAAIDRKRRLLRLKAIGSPKDIAIEFSHIIGVEWHAGEPRVAQGRQSLFRRFNPKYRTLPEYPSIRLEIATKGQGPVFEYFLLADLRDRRTLQRLYAILERSTLVAHFTHLASTETLLDKLPIQGSKYDIGWIETA